MVDWFGLILVFASGLFDFGLFIVLYVWVSSFWVAWFCLFDRFCGFTWLLLLGCMVVWLLCVLCLFAMGLGGVLCFWFVAAVVWVVLGCCGIVVLGGLL